MFSDDALRKISDYEQAAKEIEKPVENTILADALRSAVTSENSDVTKEEAVESSPVLNEVNAIADEIEEEEKLHGREEKKAKKEIAAKTAKTTAKKPVKKD